MGSNSGDNIDVNQGEIIIKVKASALFQVTSEVPMKSIFKNPKGTQKLNDTLMIVCTQMNGLHKTSKIVSYFSFIILFWLLFITSGFL